MTVSMAPTPTAAETPVRPASQADRAALDPAMLNPVDEACGVCPHPLATHDSLGERFCRATLAGAITRGCICR